MDLELILNEIVKEWSYRVPNGKPNPKNHLHLIHLREVLEETALTVDEIDLLMSTFDEGYVLTEAGEKHFWPHTDIPNIEGIGYDDEVIAEDTISLLENNPDKDEIIETLMMRAKYHKEQTSGMKKAYDVFYNYLTESDEEEEQPLSAKEVRDLIANSDSGLGTMSNSYKVTNNGGLNDEDFIKVIKKQYPKANVVVYEPKTGPNTSGRDKLFTWTWDGRPMSKWEWQRKSKTGKDYGLMLAVSATGRGTKQTKDQEMSWLLVLSFLQYGGGAAVDENDIYEAGSVMLDPSIYGKIEGMTESYAEQLVSFMEQNPAWYKSHIAQCNKFISIVGADNQPRKYVKDSSSLSINKQAKKLYQLQYNKKLDLDKWNPADVWLDYATVPTFSTLAELNNWLIDSLHQGTGFIGVSLKKGKGSIGLVNDKERKEYKLKKLDLKYGGLFSQGCEFTYSGEHLDGLGLAFRIFNGKTTDIIRGEGTAKGADAMQGKAALAIIDDFKSGTYKKVTSVKGSSVEYDSKKKEWAFTKEGKARFKTVSSAFSKISGATFNPSHGKWKPAMKSEAGFLKALNAHWKKKNVKENSIKANINSRFQTIILGSIVMSANSKLKERMMVGMLKYAKSESEWSSAHYKAQ